jgi:hypothetical protein
VSSLPALQFLDGFPRLVGVFSPHHNARLRNSFTRGGVSQYVHLESQRPERAREYFCVRRERAGEDTYRFTQTGAAPTGVAQPSSAQRFGSLSRASEASDGSRDELGGRRVDVTLLVVTKTILAQEVLLSLDEHTLFVQTGDLIPVESARERGSEDAWRPRRR